MKKQILTIVLLSTGFFLFNSCSSDELTPADGTPGTSGTSVFATGSSKTITGEGSIVSKTVDFNNFKSINVSSIVKAEVVLGTSFKITISDYENIIAFTKFEIKDNELLVTIDTPESTNLANSQSKAIITIPEGELKKLTTSGTATITLKNSFNGITDLVTMGTSSISSDAMAVTTILNADLGGSSSISFLNITADELVVNSRGTSRSTFSVTKTLNVNLNGASTVLYKGNPTITKEMSPTSTLTKL